VDFKNRIVTMAALASLATALAVNGAEAYAQDPVLTLTAEPPSEQVAAIIKEAEQYKTTHGSPPDVTFYYTAVGSSVLPGNGAHVLLAAIVGMQRPRISRDDLASLLKAKRDSIHSIRCEYTVSPGLPGKQVYAFSDNKVYLEEPRQDKESKVTPSVSTYDGTLFRSVTYHNNKDLSPAGYIDNDGSLASLFRPDMPLCRAMLFDMNRVDSTPSLTDLPNYIQLACVVYEKTTTIGGAECLLVSDGAADIYLDISRDFSVVRLDNFQIDWKDNGSGNKTVGGRRHTHRIDCADLVDYGNAIWLPNSIKVTEFASGDGPATTGSSQASSGTGTSRVITVAKMEVNPQIADSFFTDIIPKNAMVSDQAKGLRYIAGVRDSIDDTVKRTVQPKSHRITLLLVNLGAIAVLVWFIIARRRKESSQP
jgi:hypothetical protein